MWVSDSTMRVELGDESFYQGVLADVTEQIEDLEQAKKEAEESSLAKSTFLFNASHDIRTPMNAINGFAHIIEEKVQSPDVVMRNVRKLKQASGILLTLMNDILELSRIERGKEDINLKPMNMIDHAQKLKEMMVSEMAQHGIIFIMENDVEHPLVFADGLKLTRIAMNLLSNAKKFTPTGGHVTFGIKESDYCGDSAYYTLFVKDTGIGMSEEFQKKAFDQFERERSSTDSGVAGSGLGLSIIKRITDLLGGDCRIESELGKGTLVTCKVKCDIANEDDFKPEFSREDMDFTGKRALIVEDNEFNREIARYVFEGIGFEVEEATDGVECLEKLNHMKDGYYDLVLMDVQMPIMDGYTATREIRGMESEAKKNVPIIAMTANAFEEDRKRCLAVGMNGHIGKPLEAKVVLKELMRVLTE